MNIGLKVSQYSGRFCYLGLKTLIGKLLLNRDTNGKVTTQLMTNETILTSPSSTSHIYVTIYHHHLHMVCIRMSHNSFDTQEHVVHNINCSVKEATCK